MDRSRISNFIDNVQMSKTEQVPQSSLRLKSMPKLFATFVIFQKRWHTGFRKWKRKLSSPHNFEMTVPNAFPVVIASFIRVTNCVSSLRQTHILRLT